MDHKNLLIIKTDEHRWDVIGAKGHPVVRTPHLDRFYSQGINLERAFTVSPLCVPSRTSFFTGNYPHANQTAYNHEWDHLDVSQCAFFDVLKAQGYCIGLAGKNHTFQDECFEKYFDYREETSHWGKTHGHITETDRKVCDYLGHDPRPGNEDAFAMLEGLIPGPMPFREEECPTYRIGDDAVNFLEQQSADKPFCLLTMFGDPHWPNVAPEPYYSMYYLDEIQLEADPMDWEGHPFKHFVQAQAYDWQDFPIEEKKRILATYYAQVTFCDAMIGRVMETLERRGLANNTIVLFTSDHGSWGGRYGMVGKTSGFSEALIRIPACIKIPGLEPRTLNQQISNIDVLPTLFEYAGLEVPSGIQGRSFKRIIDEKSDASHREAIFAEVNEPVNPPSMIERAEFKSYDAARRERENMFWFSEYIRKGRCIMVRKDGWKYCYYTGDCPELYDLAADPLELKNLAEDPAYASKRNELQCVLIEWQLNAPWEAYRQRHVLKDGEL